MPPEKIPSKPSPPYDAQRFVLSDRDFRAIRTLVKEKTGINLGQQKKDLVVSRLARRLRVLGLGSFREYLNLLSGDECGEELVHMINRITTNKTEFFREKHHFVFLTETVLPWLHEQGEATGERVVKGWSAACSSGEEPYSLAMVMAEYFKDKPDWQFKILASDLDTTMLSTASCGEYHEKSMASVDKAMRYRYFDRLKKEGDVFFRVKPSLRQHVTFRRFNLMNPVYPFKTRLDFIFCRNVLIYFDSNDKNEILHKMHQVLRPRGFIFAGHSESLIAVKNIFAYVGATVYRKV